MKTSTRFAHAGLALKLAAGAALLPTAWAGYTAPERASPTVTTVVAAASLPPEFAVIRPAGLDGSSPPIPPSELWPAQ